MSENMPINLSAIPTLVLVDEAVRRWGASMCAGNWAWEASKSCDDLQSYTTKGHKDER